MAVAAVLALPLVHEAQLLAPDATPFDIFGTSVATDGDTVVVGASAADTPGGTGAGAAYVFVRSGPAWALQQTLVASDGAMGDSFGHAVSISGDTVAIGAYGADTAGGTTAGAAYVFVRSGTTWTEQQKLLAPDGAGFDNFGVSVSIDGDTVVIGSRLDDSPIPNAGSAYVFVRSGTAWTLQQKLTASDAGSDASFGWSVSLSGDTALVGAMEDDNAGGTDAGAGYVFVRSGTTWTEQQKLLAADGAAFDDFGYSVSVDADTALLGSPSPFSPTDAGAAYVFVRSGTSWTEQQKLLAADGMAEDRFGHAVALAGDTAVIGAYRDHTPGGEDAGSAYVFARAGTTWTEQRHLLAPDGAAFDWFGASVAIAGSRVMVGAPFDDTPAGEDAGSAHVFGPPEADLAVTKSDGQTTAVPGQPLTYTIMVSNAGFAPVAGATVTDVAPTALLGATWTCSASPGSACTGSGAGSIDDTVDLLVGGTATYLLTGTVDPAATGSLANTATVAAPPAVPDPDPTDNSATDVDTLVPSVDLAVTKTDSPDPVLPGSLLDYVLVIANAGPSDATAVTAVDTLPAGVTFVSSSPGPPACVLAGAALTCALGPLGVGASLSVTIDVTVNTPGGVLVNTATVSGGEPDPDPANNSAFAATLVGQGDGELAHGTRALHDLAAQPGPAADVDIFRVSQKPYSSYEVVVDATSGDIDAGGGPLLERVGPDGTTVLQAALPIGTGSSRSLRWANLTSAVVEDQTIRVGSAGCSTDCGPDDVYAIRAYETTYAVPRFNNSGTQVTLLLLQDPADYPISGEVYFRDETGALLAVQGFALAAKQTVVLDTSTVPGAGNAGGTMTIAHDGRYGDLSGKTVALEPATGFSFDSPLDPRVR
jgi:uncharacterized repeat protein (TIGR01451 family)